jgi:hypothetical protein
MPSYPRYFIVLARDFARQMFRVAMRPVAKFIGRNYATSVEGSPRRHDEHDGKTKNEGLKMMNQ